MKALMCVPNISEGTDLAVVEKMVDTVRSSPGVMLLDYSSNSDHNRSVITYIGQPEPVLAATRKLAETALGLIDMTCHKGSHPRQGAVDVVPFIPIRGISEEEAVSIARDFGRYVGDTLGVPVYFYEDAATRPDRQNLAKVRKGQYEALARKLEDRRGHRMKVPVNLSPEADPCRSHPVFPWWPSTSILQPPILLLPRILPKVFVSSMAASDMFEPSGSPSKRRAWCRYP